MTGGGEPAHVDADHLGTLARNDLVAPLQDSPSITLYTTPTRLQEIAFERLGIDPRRVQ
jgi:hypothetical protein